MVQRTGHGETVAGQTIGEHSAAGCCRGVRRYAVYILPSGSTPDACAGSARVASLLLAAPGLVRKTGTGRAKRPADVEIVGRVSLIGPAAVDRRGVPRNGSAASTRRAG